MRAAPTSCSSCKSLLPGLHWRLLKGLPVLKSICGCSEAFWQRCWASATEKTLKLGATLACVYITIAVCVPTLICLVSTASAAACNQACGLRCSAASQLLACACPAEGRRIDAASCVWRLGTGPAGRFLPSSHAGLACTGFQQLLPMLCVRAACSGPPSPQMLSKQGASCHPNKVSAMACTSSDCSRWLCSRAEAHSDNPT